MVILLLLVTHFYTKTTRMTSLKCLLAHLKKDALKEKLCRNYRGDLSLESALGLLFPDHCHSVALQ